MVDVTEKILVQIEEKKIGEDVIEKELETLGYYGKEAKKLSKLIYKQTQLEKKKRRGEKDTQKASIDTYRTYLPVIFAAQAFAQATKSILQPSMDLLGVQDIYNTFMGAAFLPTAEKTLDSVLDFGDALLGLSEEQRAAIGSGIQHAQIMAEGAQIGSSMAVSLAGLIGEAFAWVGAAGGAAAASYALSNDTMTALSAVSGLGDAFIIVGSLAYGAGTQFGATKTEAEELAAVKMAMLLTVNRDEFNTAKTDVDNWVAQQQDKFINLQFGIFGLFGVDFVKMGRSLLHWLGIPGFQSGGVMQETGLAYLHKGETVTPAGDSNSFGFSPTINISASAGSDTDLRSLAAKLNQYMYEEYRRLSMRL